MQIIDMNMHYANIGFWYMLGAMKEFITPKMKQIKRLANYK